MSENTELTREQQIEIEEKAIQALLNMGVKFSVNLRINPVKAPFYIRWWNKMFPDHVKVWHDRRIPKDWDVELTDVPDATTQRMVRVYRRHFHIKPLYLGTIDSLRRLYLQIDYNEQDIEASPTKESKRLFKYIPLMAEIAAVAAINNPSVAEPSRSKEVKRLKAFFMEHLTVAMLKRLCDVIAQMMNPSGFISSIGLIREVGTTKAHPVE